MSILNELLTFDLQNEHDLEHDLIKKPQFSTPKIYNAKGDLSKRWYVYFSYRNPKTGKLERMKNIYGKVNYYKTKEDRMTVLSKYRSRLVKLLKAGFNPFEDNTELYQSRLAKKQESEVPKVKAVIERQPEAETKPEPVVEKVGPVLEMVEMEDETVVPAKIENQETVVSVESKPEESQEPE
ncbi:hypothetical protein [Formosa sp. A9]|uniref:hypothetical protein n=1 Tax=Formosa sp. A9 TaxID=3442641 RepID=UPI003EBDC839